MDDVIPQDCLIVKLLRSPHANAIVKNIDTSRAMLVPGMEVIYTWKDVDQNARRYTQAGQTYPEMSPYDRLVIDRHVRFAGDVVAILAGKDETCVDKAMKLIKVRYEVLPAVTSGIEAIKDGAPQLYPDMFKNNIVTPGYPPFQKDGPFWHLVKGDPEKGFEECAYIAEDTVEFSKMAAPASPEPPGAIVRWEGDRDFTVWCDTQSGYICKVTNASVITDCNMDIHLSLIHI